MGAWRAAGPRAPTARVAAILAGTATVLYGVLAWARWHRADTPSWDLAIFTQAVRHYANLQAPVSEVKGPGFNLLGDHFSPLLAALAPVYRLFPHTLTLLLCQVALVGLSVFPVTRLAVSSLGRRAGICVGAAYALSFGLQQAVDSEFHEVALAVPLVAFALVALAEDRPAAVLAWAFPLVLVKEDLGLTVAVIGLVLVLRGHRRHGWAAAAFGVVATALEVVVIMPRINAGHGYGYWSALGPATLGDGAGTKALTLLALVGITAFVALRSPILLVALPTLAWRFLGSSPAYWGTAWHYDAVLMPVVFVALVDGLVRLRASPHPWLVGAARVAPAAVLGIAVVWTAWLPVRDLVQPSTYRGPQRAAAAAGALAMIPAGSVVETDKGLLNQLVDDRTVYWTTLAGSVLPDFMLLDTQAGWAPAPPADLVAVLRGLHPSAHYDLVYSRDGYSVLQRVKP